MDDSAEELDAVSSDVISKPLVQIEVFSAGGKRCNIERKCEWAYFEQGFKDLSYNLALATRKHEETTDFKILSYIKNAGDIKRIFFIKITEGVCKVGWFNLPYAHKDKLMVGMASKKHSKQFARIIKSNVIPIGILLKREEDEKKFAKEKSYGLELAEDPCERFPG